MRRNRLRNCTLFAGLPAAILALGLGTGCDKKSSPAKQAPAKAPAQKSEAQAPAAQNPAPKQAAKAPLAAKFDASMSLAKFATALMAKESANAKAEDNLVISPMSVFVALGMTRTGAAGSTASQLSQAMAIPETTSTQSIGDSLGSAQRIWTQPREGTTLAIANRLFADESFQVKPSFVQSTQKQFGSGIQNLSFEKAAQKARGVINQWVATQTKNRIKELLKPGDVSSATRMVIVNAIWFKGQWAHKFDKKKTKSRPFKLSSGKRIKVPTMAQTLVIPYFESKSDGYRAIDLPYADGRLAMSIVVPSKGTSLKDLQAKLRYEDLGGALKDAMPMKVELELPKFKLSPESSTSLRPTLEQMGITSMFGKADFSAMASKNEKISVSDVVHKAMIIVDEEGSEAAAATGVTLYRTAAVKTIPMKVDRPFLFAIRDKSSQAVLFAGKVAHPKFK